jgi:hypothetical protein
MTRRAFLVACCVVASAVSTFAQTPGGKASADPISGTWTGDLVITDGPRTIPVTMELKFDGKKAVSGTVSGLPSPAEVKSGTFDPKSGALTLRLGKQSAPDVLLVLEGTVAKGTASGRFTGDESGEFKIAKKP